MSEELGQRRGWQCQQNPSNPTRNGNGVRSQMRQWDNNNAHHLHSYYLPPLSTTIPTFPSTLQARMNNNVWNTPVAPQPNTDNQSGSDGGDVVVLRQPKPENSNVLNIQMSEKVDKKPHNYLIFTELAQGSCSTKGIKKDKGKKKMACYAKNGVVPNSKKMDKSYYNDNESTSTTTSPDLKLRLGIN